MVKCFVGRGELVPAINHSINRDEPGNWSGVLQIGRDLTKDEEESLTHLVWLNAGSCIICYKEYLWLWKIIGSEAHEMSAAAFRELSKIYCLVIINYPSINDKCSRKSTWGRSCSKEKSKSSEGANVLEHLQEIDSTSKSTDLIHMKVVEGW